MRTALLILASAILLAGCRHGRLRLAPGEEGEVIETEGWAPIDSADVLGTKRRSLADAEKKAVERVAGVFISAKTRVEQTVAVDERIMANVSGYIRKYDILGERKEDGFLKTRIRAVVLYKKLGDDLKNLGLNKPPAPPGNPHFAIFIRTGGSSQASQDGAAAQGLRAVLLDHGFSVVDKDDPSASDLLFKGEAEVHPIDDPDLGGLHSARARVSVHVLNPRSKEAVADRSKEASALDISAEVAAAKALGKAGALVGEALVKDLAPLLKSQIGIAVKVHGLEDLEQVRELIDDIRTNPEVDAVTLSNYQPGLAELQVTTEGVPGDELSTLILRRRKSHFSALSVSAYALELTAR